MTLLFRSLLGAASLAALPVLADIPDAARHADVVILGEQHDNPDHHARQLDYLRAIAPRAVVYEMLTPDEAALLARVERDPDTITEALTGFHWSNIGDYTALLSASPVIVGAALSREDMRAAFDIGAAGVLGDAAELYGLTSPLPETEQTLREDLQFAAHCDAMPRDLMPGMVEAQRLRDAAFARAVIDAMDTHGAPIVLITGNGHARLDWGVPSYLARVRPDLTVFSLGQAESDQIAGNFDHVVSAKPPERGDPCAAFN